MLSQGLVLHQAKIPQRRLLKCLRPAIHQIAEVGLPSVHQLAEVELPSKLGDHQIQQLLKVVI